MKIILKSRLIVVFLVTFIPFTVIAQDRLSIAEVKDGLHVITGPGGNIGVRVTAEGVILIDDKYPQDFDEIQSLVATVSDLPVKYVINTHHHGDHSGSNASFLQVADVIAHKNARDNMIRGDQDGLPGLIYTDQTSVFLGGAEVRAYYMGRGHTNGDSVVYFPDLKTVHGGDLLHGTAPFIDYANGGSSRGWVNTMNNILSLDWNTAIPGHGEVMNRRDVLNFRNQMEAVRIRMAELVRQGLVAGDASEAIKDPNLSWTQAENGLFMNRSIPGFYEEIAGEL
ncbi:MAG: MBL fold metallo-hydrolase [Pseudomonadota bacterium]|nr:MBL fold metallo-hydrolase [Pseudomonadota bacterium]|tara:strand:+ start:1146 stop:1991 length:846 start_codon:yes stop_codon:yes gene_type:complete